MATILVVTANPLLDHIADETCQIGRINRCQSFTVAAGGKGLNVGRLLALHGHRVLACGFAGGDTGQTFSSIVESEGQEAHFTQTTARLRVGFLAREHTGMLENGFTVRDEEKQSCLNTVISLLPQADLVICSGSIPDLSCTTLYAHILQACQQAVTPCWIDSYGPALDAALAYGPDLIKPNAEELAQLSVTIPSTTEIHITNGHKAIQISKEKEHYTVQPPLIKTVNAVGSGDSYIAALAHARLSKMPLTEQYQYAAAAGSCNAAQMSIADMSPADIQTMRSQVNIS